MSDREDPSGPSGFFVPLRTSRDNATAEGWGFVLDALGIPNQVDRGGAVVRERRHPAVPIGRGHRDDAVVPAGRAVGPGHALGVGREGRIEIVVAAAVPGGCDEQDAGVAGARDRVGQRL